ncbi:glycerol-3-phosphate dehydrogenase/oxidase [candidate division KSB1 bacterium]|nr:glycerol-3-phosphate dehydrogenase/oxidase [candidate division KSB1 bacterium]
MKRNLNALAHTDYDVIIIGAGIYGVTLAWDAVLRGLHVALIDKGDFACATSSNSLKIIHGGLRYLQQLDIPRMRESIRERMILMRIAPHLVHPLPCVMPTYGKWMNRREMLALAMGLNDLIGFDRNQLNDPQKYLPAGKTISRPELKIILGEYSFDGLNGGAHWYDCQCYNTERLALSFLISAANLGADIANYVKATGFIVKQDRITGITVADQLNHETFEIHGKIVINASGPWIDDVLTQLPGGASRRKWFNFSTATNLVLKHQVLPNVACGLPNRFTFKTSSAGTGKAIRMLFLAPWRNVTIAGTNHLPVDRHPEGFRVTESEINQFIEALNAAYPASKITRDAVGFVYKGILPKAGIHRRTGEVILEKHYKIIDHAKVDGITGLLTVLGVKYTTARNVAQSVIDLVAKKLGKTRPKSKSDITRLYGAEIDSFEEFQLTAQKQHQNNFEPQVIKHLVYNYGSAYPEILKLAASEPPYAGRIAGSTEVLKAEILHAVRQEMAMKLSDVILRRTDLGSAGLPGDAAIDECASIMADELNWSLAGKAEEIAEVIQLYQAA